MNLYTDYSFLDKNKSYVVTVGTFDGVHIGHQEILTSLIDEAKVLNADSLVFTFEPHPRSIVSKNFNLRLLTTYSEKVELFESYGIENLFIASFNEEFAKLSFEDFVKKYFIDKINTKKIVIGYDHRFGKDRTGDEINLKLLGTKYGFDVDSIPAKIKGDEIVSSTKIRYYLESGEIKKANSYLNRNYSISGVVVEGAKRGRTLGYPTANVNVKNSSKAIPAVGVYIAYSFLEGEKFASIVNIGLRPTFTDSHEIVIESHLLDFGETFYGKEIKIEFIDRLREEIKFSKKEELISQLNLDKAKARKYL
ncbi:MAG: bifunctional riboflavin kinase/FAD synthetase [Melioribacteraceae bacterium]|nr:bifunctional riboflavin kinase/FAD synthetase [Melioribacteraceae bacterium]